MNNARLTIGEDTLREEPVVDIKPWLRERETELVEIIAALEAIGGSKHWKVLQQKIFSESLEVLQKRMRTERDSKELYRLQGQWGWADKFADLEKMANLYRQELQKVKQQLK